jgi:hypothetical protein
MGAEPTKGGFGVGEMPESFGLKWLWLLTYFSWAKVCHFLAANHFHKLARVLAKYLVDGLVIQVYLLTV